MTQMVKNLPAMQETQVQILGQEDTLGNGMATNSSIFAWRIPWTESLAGYCPWGHNESDMTDWQHNYSYDYTVEVANRFKWLGLINRGPKELWMEVCNTVQEAVIKTIPKKQKCKKAKWLSEEALQTAKKRSERQKIKGKIYPTECEFQRILRRDKNKWTMQGNTGKR